LWCRDVLRLLTDEHVSPAVGTEAKRRWPDLDIVALRDWRGGHLLSATDEILLGEAHLHERALVTYDLRTIPPLLRAWAEQGVDHGGVVLVDPRTIRQNDIGGLVAALGALWIQQGQRGWTNRVVFLRRG